MWSATDYHPRNSCLKKVLYRVLRLVRRFFDWKLVPIFFRILFFPESDSDAIAMLSGVILNGLHEANEMALRSFARGLFVTTADVSKY